ncbi:MAG: hypothetical protein Q7T55_11500, partial [Solirubrobacteraceae bacterium]|nr:hypothetical protein [Solirubrobacteraceae bacterium]
PFGMVILEALNQGCEVLAFEGGGPDDLARSFPKAVQTVSREPGSLAEALNAWHERGARPTVEHSGQVRNMLESTYSEAPAADRWERLLAATAA